MSNVQSNVDIEKLDSKMGEVLPYIPLIAIYTLTQHSHTIFAYIYTN